jgi:hypothetical protein
MTDVRKFLNPVYSCDLVQSDQNETQCRHKTLQKFSLFSIFFLSLITTPQTLPPFHFTPTLHPTPTPINRAATTTKTLQNSQPTNKSEKKMKHVNNIKQCYDYDVSLQV